MKEVVVLGKAEEGNYTVFKNHDEELVNKIKAVKIDDDTFPYHGFIANSDTCKIDKELPNGKFQCSDEEGNVFTLDKEDIEDAKRTALLNKINNLYPVHKYFHENFGTRIRVSGTKEECDYDDLSKCGYSERRIDTYTYQGVGAKIETGHWVSIMFCYFNEEGNYVNRDYNIDIERTLKEKEPTAEEILKTIAKDIPDVEYGYDEKKDRYFADQFMYTMNDFTDLDQEDDKQDHIGFKLHKSEVRSTGKYGNRGESPVSRPKDVVAKTKADIIERIAPLVDKLFQPLPERKEKEEVWDEI